MRLLIRAGRIITPRLDVHADLLCEGGRITAWHEVGQVPLASVDDHVDASGLVVLPGLIDPHVHSRDPGQTHKETFDASTRAAAKSGITTVLEMPNAVPPVLDGVSFRERVTYLSQHAHVDFGLWGLALDSTAESKMASLASEGAVAVKVFWGFVFDRKDARLTYAFPEEAEERYVFPLSAAALLEILEAAVRHNMLVGVHCEERSILELMQRRHGGYEDYAGLNRSRPAVAEAVSVATLAELAAHTGARVHVLHLSSHEAVEVVSAAQRRGIAITAETCPHYLLLTADDYGRLGPAMKIYPPVRSASDREALWRAVASGGICSVASDHAPHAEAEREGPLHAQPAGTRSIHATVPVLLDGVHRGRLTLGEVASCLSESTARLYGLYPRKGSLLPGADADVTIVDMNASWTLDGPSGTAFPLTDPWRGRKGKGRAVASVIRGRVVMRDGEMVTEHAGTFVGRAEGEVSVTPED